MNDLKERTNYTMVSSERINRFVGSISMVETMLSTFGQSRYGVWSEILDPETTTIFIKDILKYGEEHPDIRVQDYLERQNVHRFLVNKGKVLIKVVIHPPEENEDDDGTEISQFLLDDVVTWLNEQLEYETIESLATRINLIIFH